MFLLAHRVTRVLSWNDCNDSDESLRPRSPAGTRVVRLMSAFAHPAHPAYVARVMRDVELHVAIAILSAEIHYIAPYREGVAAHASSVTALDERLGNVNVPAKKKKIDAAQSRHKETRKGGGRISRREINARLKTGF